MKNLYRRGYSNQERQVAINPMSNVVLKYGSLTDFKLFSHTT
jgi:hypothetical protein